MGFVTLQRLQLARTRLLVVGGAVDVGKTTILREAFGYGHLAAGLSQRGRTDEVAFELHPDGDEQLCPAYVVDTPGFGDGDQLHRNDMGRMVASAERWVPGGVTLLWVVKAGRHVRQEADDLLRNMMESGLVPLVAVTHMDKLFEERYREAGPQWRDGVLEGVPLKDPRWKEHRRMLMEELREEVCAAVRCVVGEEVEPEILFACLDGWMVNDEEDEFAQRPPWPWAREELSAFFNILDRQELRNLLDAKLFSCPTKPSVPRTAA